MINKTKHEKEAMIAAQVAGGEVIESMIEEGYEPNIGEWPEEAYAGFCEAIVTAYQTKLVELAASDKPPF